MPSLGEVDSLLRTMRDEEAAQRKQMSDLLRQLDEKDEENKKVEEENKKRTAEAVAAIEEKQKAVERFEDGDDSEARATAQRELEDAQLQKKLAEANAGRMKEEGEEYQKRVVQQAMLLRKDVDGDQTKVSKVAMSSLRDIARTCVAHDHHQALPARSVALC